MHERYRQTTDRQIDGRTMTYSEREREFTTSRSLISSILQIYVRGARSRLSLRARRDHDPALGISNNLLNDRVGLVSSPDAIRNAFRTVTYRRNAANPYEICPKTVQCLYLLDVWRQQSKLSVKKWRHGGGTECVFVLVIVAFRTAMPHKDVGSVALWDFQRFSPDSRRSASLLTFSSSANISFWLSSTLTSSFRNMTSCAEIHRIICIVICAHPLNTCCLSATCELLHRRVVSNTMLL